MTTTNLVLVELVGVAVMVLLVYAVMRHACSPRRDVGQHRASARRRATRPAAPPARPAPAAARLRAATARIADEPTNPVLQALLRKPTGATA